MKKINVLYQVILFVCGICLFLFFRWFREIVRPGPNCSKTGVIIGTSLDLQF